MFKKRTMVVNGNGIHARPASNFVARAKKYQSKIKIRNLAEKDTDTANAKSIIEVLMLAISKGTEIELCAEGEDEEKAVNELVDYINAGLGE